MTETEPIKDVSNSGSHGSFDETQPFKDHKNIINSDEKTVEVKEIITVDIHEQHKSFWIYRILILTGIHIISLLGLFMLSFSPFDCIGWFMVYCELLVLYIYGFVLIFSSNLCEYEAKTEFVQGIEGYWTTVALTPQQNRTLHSIARSTSLKGSKTQQQLSKLINAIAVQGLCASFVRLHDLEKKLDPYYDKNVGLKYASVLIYILGMIGGLLLSNIEIDYRGDSVLLKLIKKILLSMAIIAVNIGPSIAYSISKNWNPASIVILVFVLLFSFMWYFVITIFGSKSYKSTKHVNCCSKFFISVELLTLISSGIATVLFVFDMSWL